MDCGEEKTHCQQCSPRLGPFDPCYCLLTPVPPCHSYTHSSSTPSQLYPLQFHPVTVIPTLVPPCHSYTLSSSTPPQLYPLQFHPVRVISTLVPPCHSYTHPSSTLSQSTHSSSTPSVIPTPVPPCHSYTHSSPTLPQLYPLQFHPVTVYPLQFHPVTVYPLQFQPVTVYPLHFQPVTVYPCEIIFMTPSPFKCNVVINLLFPSMSVNDATVTISPSLPHLALIIDSYSLLDSMSPTSAR